MKKVARRSNWPWHAARSSTTSVRRKRNARGSVSADGCYGRKGKRRNLGTEPAQTHVRLFAPFARFRSASGQGPFSSVNSTPAAIRMTHLRDLLTEKRSSVLDRLSQHEGDALAPGRSDPGRVRHLDRRKPQQKNRHLSPQPSGLTAPQRASI